MWEVFPALAMVKDQGENGADWAPPTGLITLELEYLDGNGVAHRERVLLDEEGFLQLNAIDEK